MSNVLALQNIHKEYIQAKQEPLTILENTNLTLKSGDIASLVGPSGCGKSTLMHIAGLLDKYTSGDVLINDISTYKLKDTEKTRLRLNHIGFIYQQHHLLPEFSALDNIAMPIMLLKKSRKEARKEAEILLERVGLSDRANHRPGQLSGGQQQRVAIARALANSPSLILADEPTGNLDPTSADTIFNLLIENVKSTNSALLMVTHNHELATKTTRQFVLENGEINET